MKIYLAALEMAPYCQDIFPQVPYVLTSYYYLRKYYQPMAPVIHSAKLFMLDSGAFSFMSQAAKVDFDAYLDQYIAFIKQENIRHFFELDIDSIVGYEKVKELRDKLEFAAGKACIPVWHKSRGLEDFHQMCSEYRYVAIGGIVAKEISRLEYQYLPKLISIAHRHGCQIHGLGFTNTVYLPTTPFDSVDSSSWSAGSRFGTVYQFRKGKLQSYTDDNSRLRDYRQTNRHNLHEWIKYQHYAEVWL